MSVKQITTDDLRKMKDTEGFILQGCGGSLDEWVDGILNSLHEQWKTMPMRLCRQKHMRIILLPVREHRDLARTDSLPMTAYR